MIMGSVLLPSLPPAREAYLLIKKRPLQIACRGREFPWYHLSLPPTAASSDTDISWRCNGRDRRCLLVSFSKLLGRVFDIRAPAVSHQPTALLGLLRICTWLRRRISYIKRTLTALLRNVNGKSKKFSNMLFRARRLKRYPIPACVHEALPLGLKRVGVALAI